MTLTVLNVSYSLAPVSPSTAGGAEQILLSLDKALVRSGHRSIVVAPHGSQTNGLLRATPKLPQRLDAQAKLQARWHHAQVIRRALHDFRVDVVHLHGLDFVDYLPTPGVPVIVTLHLPPAWYSKEITSIHRPDLYFVCVSDSQKRACPPGLNVTTVIHNGVETGPVRSKKGNYLLSMGRICPEKGFHLAMDAASQSGLPLFMAGQVFEYPEHRAYFEEFIRPRLRDGHRFIGPVAGQRKWQLIAGARAMLIPSLAQETSSLISMEALACRTPVIAFPSGALPDIVEHESTGFLVQSVQEMARAIAELPNLDPRECRRAQSRFSEHTMTSRYLELYSRVASGQIEALEYTAA